MSTIESRGEPSDTSIATHGEIAEYLHELIRDLITIATSARMPRVVQHLEAASMAAKSERDKQSLNS
jgi:hypothetical protein